MCIGNCAGVKRCIVHVATCSGIDDLVGPCYILVVKKLASRVVNTCVLVLWNASTVNVPLNGAPIEATVIDCPTTMSVGSNVLMHA